MNGMNAARNSRLTSALAMATAVVALALFTVGCGGSDDASSSKLTVTGQWARTSPMNAANGAAYFTITSPEADTLLGVKVEASVAAMAEMHETVMATDTTMAMGTATTMAGMGEMTMQPVDSIDLPAGTAVSLQPGGLHIMLMDLAKPLEAGTTIELTLSLKNGGETVIEVPVLDEAP